MFLVVSSVLMFCVPIIGLLAVSLAIKLRRTLRDDTLDYRKKEKTVFWVIFFACVCLCKIMSVSLFDPTSRKCFRLDGLSVCLSVC